MRSMIVTVLSLEADNVLSIDLRPVDDDPLPPWSPGDHIDVHLNGGEFVRQYSLCGPPDAPFWRIAVLKVPDSRGGSLAVHDLLRPGQILDVDGPRSNFALRPARRYVFVAGGIGITPILSMVRQVAQTDAAWELWYGARSAAHMPFAEELAALGAAQGEARSSRVTFVPQDRDGLLDVTAIVATPTPETLMYCCGPTGLLDAMAQASAHWPAESLEVERFSVAAIPAEAGGDGFCVEAVRSGVTVDVPAGTSIVDALEASGVAVETSCLEGICGTCETAVLDGTPEHHDSLLTDAERQEGKTMMICVGRARSSKLVLDV